MATKNTLSDIIKKRRKKVEEDIAAGGVQFELPAEANDSVLGTRAFPIQSEFEAKEPTVATVDNPLVDRDKATTTPVTPVQTGGIAESEFTVSGEPKKSLAELQIESDIAGVEKKRDEQLATSQDIFQEELARETARIEEAGKKTMDTMTRSLSLRGGLRGTAGEQKMGEVTEQVNNLISTAQRKADLELQLRDAKIRGASEATIDSLNQNLSTVKSNLAEQEAANIEAQLEVAGEIGADALESVLGILESTGADTSTIDQERSKETSYLINRDGSLFLGSNGKPVPLVKNNEFGMEVNLKNFKDANDNTYVYKNGQLSEVITNDGRLLKGSDLDNFKVPATVEEDKTMEEQRKLETQLRNEFIKRPEVKRFQEIGAQFERVKQGADANNASGDLALIFSFMKMLDPASVVREGEFATAQNAAGIPDQIRNLYNKARVGTRLGADQRGEFRKTAENLFKKEVENFNKVKSGFETIVEDSGARKEFVILGEEFNTDEPTLEVPETEIDAIFGEDNGAEFMGAEVIETSSGFIFNPNK